MDEIVVEIENEDLPSERTTSTDEAEGGFRRRCVWLRG